MSKESLSSDLDRLIGDRPSHDEEGKPIAYVVVDLPPRKMRDEYWTVMRARLSPDQRGQFAKVFPEDELEAWFKRRELLNELFGILVGPGGP